MAEKSVEEKATLGGGCFWCLEAVFELLDGVSKVESGYAGGSVPNPTYQQVCTGSTGHAEVIQITYDPGVVSYRNLLVVFFSSHDPTSLNRQGADVGTQYRSAIFYHDAAQQKTAGDFIRELNDELGLKKPVVTEVVPLTIFYRAEDYHQGYFRNHPDQGYCQMVVAPKVAKLRQHFAALLAKIGS